MPVLYIPDNIYVFYLKQALKLLSSNVLCTAMNHLLKKKEMTVKMPASFPHRRID